MTKQEKPVAASWEAKYLALFIPVTTLLILFNAVQIQAKEIQQKNEVKYIPEIKPDTVKSDRQYCFSIW